LFPQDPSVNYELFRPELTRRAFLSALPPAVAALIAAARAEGADSAGEVGAFTFFQINDLHYMHDDCGRWFRSMVGQMKASAPKAELCLVCGDLADRGDEPSLRAVNEIFGALGIPVMPVPGNHDFTPKESREAYDAVFAGKLNYSVDHHGWQFVGLDTTMGTKYNGTSIAESTLAWVDEALGQLSAKAPTVVFTHFPLGEGVSYRPLNAGALLERLLKLNLVAVFSGHWHGASERKASNALLTTSRCAARVRNNADRSPLKGWFVCEALADGSLTRRFVEFQAPADIPTLDVAAPKAPAK
jgi:3',5'-cyclic AMP phosphodiesterase CpdA